MENHEPSSKSRTLPILLLATVLTGALVAYLTVKKERYFPHLYSHHPEAGHEENVKLEEEEAHSSHSLDSVESAAHKNEITETKPVQADHSLLSGSQFLLIAGSFQSEENAESLKQRLDNSGLNISPEIITATVDGRMYYRIVVYRSGDYHELSKLAASLSNEGFRDCWISP